MEQDRFDALAISLADEGTSRRSVLGRITASGVAAALGITAFTAFEDEDAEAKKSCKKRCKKKNTAKKRRKCRKKCNKNNSSRCAINTDCKGGQVCLNAQCTSTCTGSAQCDSGKVCVNGACLTGCLTADQCSGGETCVNGGCTTLCTTSGDCTGGQECIEGVCGTPNTPPDDPAVNLCDSDAQCPGGICATGVCILGCEDDSNCAGALVCGNLLGATGPKVCIAPSTPCGPQNPCTGSALSLCLLGICVELG
jgi:hypothetical protein